MAMVTIPNNIVVGTPLVYLDTLGIPEEETVHFVNVDEVKNAEGEIFLPTLLKHLGIFKSTNEIKKVNQQRMESEKFKSIPEQNLWRTLTRPEFTHFKIGKKVFWLIVGIF